MKRELPILFSTDMVQAILAGRKTQTRRAQNLTEINPQAEEIVRSEQFRKKGGWVARKKLESNPDRYEATNIIKCPYGEPGDRLWVRETWRHSDNIGNPYDYFAQFKEEYNQEYLERTIGTWKPSIHMSKAAARIWLEVTSVHVERLNAISEADAIAEGIEVIQGIEELQDVETGETFNGSGDLYKHYTGDEGATHCIWATESYETLWEKINGPGSWDANPWVWVVKFRVIEKG